MTPRLLITPGEPAGVGPDIAIAAAMQDWPFEIIMMADPELIEDRAKAIKQSIHIEEAVLDTTPSPHKAGKLKVFPIKLAVKVKPGEPQPENAEYILQTLKKAADFCLANKAQAIVTGPVNKEIINQAQIPFTGHTEFFASYAEHSKTVMLFVVNKLRVALLTTHLPLRAVADAITKERLHNTLTILHHSLTQQFGIEQPRILVAGLNPHAGEGGYLGREELDIITPAIQEIKHSFPGVEGPFSADTLFTPKLLKEADAILAMYHDQALPIVKYIGFGEAVNVTLGLPFIRTSVDHGTAFDVAGTDKVDANSMLAAIKLAGQLSQKIAI